MSRHAYSEKLRDPRWQRKRLEALERAGWLCEGCGAKDRTLFVHHGYYERDTEPWEYDIQTLWSLCEECHDAAEILRRDVYWELAHINPLRLSPVPILDGRTEEDVAESIRRHDPFRGLSRIRRKA